MKILAENFIKTFPTLLCLTFIKTKGNTTQHPEFGTDELTAEQLDNSLDWYKQKLYKNIIACIDAEILQIQAGEIGNMDEPLVGEEFVKMFYKYGIHPNNKTNDLNRRLKYPELMDIVDKLEAEKKWLSPKIMSLKVESMVKEVESKMPYKALFVYECLGYEV